MTDDVNKRAQDAQTLLEQQLARPSLQIGKISSLHVVIVGGLTSIERTERPPFPELDVPGNAFPQQVAETGVRSYVARPTGNGSRAGGPFVRPKCTQLHTPRRHRCFRVLFEEAFH